MGKRIEARCGNVVVTIYRTQRVKKSQSCTNFTIVNYSEGKRRLRYAAKLKEAKAIRPAPPRTSNGSRLMNELRVMPPQAQGAAAAATRQLEQIFPETDRLLANRVDRLIWQFRESTPEFYEKYQVARTTVDAPTTSAAEPSAVVSVPSTKAA